MLSALNDINIELKVLVLTFIVVIAIVLTFDDFVTSALVVATLVNCLFGYYFFKKSIKINGESSGKKKVSTKKEDDETDSDADELTDDDMSYELSQPRDLLAENIVDPHELEFAGSQDQVYYVNSPHLAQYDKELGEGYSGLATQGPIPPYYNSHSMNALAQPPIKSQTNPYGVHPEFNYAVPYGCGRTVDHKSLDMRAQMHGGDSDIVQTGQYGEDNHLQHNRGDPNQNLSHGTYEGFVENPAYAKQYPQMPGVDTRWMNTRPGSNPKYTACYDTKSSSDVNMCNLVGNMSNDEKIAYQASHRERSKRVSDGWATKNANYYKKHGFEEELAETEAERWWGANEY